MNFKLTTTQRNMLSIAAQREDRCLESSSDLRGNAARAFTKKLIDAGFAREVLVKEDMPTWRHDKDSSRLYSLKLTASGLKLVSEISGVIATSLSAKSQSGSSIPRKTSKLSKVMLMLSQEYGSTINEISRAMDWLPHTTRAMLTGLRKRGIQIIRLTREGERSSSYRIEPSPETNLAA